MTAQDDAKAAVAEIIEAIAENNALLVKLHDLVEKGVMPDGSLDPDTTHALVTQLRAATASLKAADDAADDVLPPKTEPPAAPTDPPTD